MKNLILFSLVLLTFSLQTSFAQNSKIKYPYFEASARIGLLPTFAKDAAISEVPAIGFDLDYRINQKFSVGFFSGYTKQLVHSAAIVGDEEPMTSSNQFTTTGLKFAVHSTNLKKWDFYGGMSLAYTHLKIKVIKGRMNKHDGMKESSGTMVYSAFVGAKFLITKDLSVFGEVGSGISLLSVGISKKF